jgi:hypothetical protein
MAGEVQFQLDTAPLIAALAAFPEACQRHCTEAARVTAELIVAEAKSRLSRQLGQYSTGATLAGITARPYGAGTFFAGYEVASEREPQPNLPLWLEKGTKPAPRHRATAAKPYFYVAAELEVAPYLDRLTDAIQAAIDEQGLGS